MITEPAVRLSRDEPVDGPRIGTAGWAIARDSVHEFPDGGSRLEQYAARFPVVEINSSFHRPHRENSWARWRDSVPETFRFSVKVPKEITHQRKLMDCRIPVQSFLAQVGHLGGKLGVLLLQLPPKLEFDPRSFGSIIGQLADGCNARIVCEPRHPSWFTAEADELMQSLRIARVGADPPRTESGAEPGGWGGLSYFRLHGSPVIYRSSYADRLGTIADSLRSRCATGDAWCIFDNTASSAATGDALALLALTTAGGFRRKRGPREE